MKTSLKYRKEKILGKYKKTQEKKNFSENQK